MYVKGNGGKCKICDSVRHRAGDCPELKKREGAGGNGHGSEEEAIVPAIPLGPDEDDFMAQSRVRMAQGDLGNGKKQGGKKEKKPFNNNGLREPYKKEDQLLGAGTKEAEAAKVSAAEMGGGKPMKAKAKVVAF